MKILKQSMFALAMISFFAFLVGCGVKAVKEGSKVSFSYTAKDPETQELLLNGEKSDLVLGFTGTDLFRLLKGAKVGETKTELLTDPLNEHNPEFMYKQTAIVFEEMGIPAEIGKELTVGDQTAKVVDIVSENGIEQVVLDANPLETTSPLLWSFTLTEIK